MKIEIDVTKNRILFLYESNYAITSQDIDWCNSKAREIYNLILFKDNPNLCGIEIKNEEWKMDYYPFYPQPIPVTPLNPFQPPYIITCNSDKSTIEHWPYSSPFVSGSTYTCKFNIEDNKNGK